MDSKYKSSSLGHIALSTHIYDNTQSTDTQSSSRELSVQSVYWGFMTEA